jgi:16S rRNA (cytosine967-C5)-methyltransferase
VTEFLKQYDFNTVELMLAASLKEKETTIRCNRAKITPEQLKEALLKDSITVEDSIYLDYAFKIKDYDYLEKLEPFLQGYFTVQDVSSMLVCETAGIRKDSIVIDVCAAPGGKALHAAETARKVLARDLTEYKIKLIQDNIKRLGITNVETMVWDAAEIDKELLGCADVVIADLPCSGLGVTGKKMDIKYKLSQNQHNDLIELQRRILETVQNYVKEDGVLIFSTCTVNQGENQENRTWFLKNFHFEPDNLDSYLPEQLKCSTTQEGYLQLLQGIHDTDGFFIAKFRKKKSSDES